MLKITSLILGLSMLFSTTNASSQVVSTYTQDFSSYNLVTSDFEAYQVYTLGGKSEYDTIYDGYSESARWYVENGQLNRRSLQNEINVDNGTNSIGIVTYTKKKYTNFELTVDYKMGLSTYYWPVVAFRQTEVGQYHLADGAGAFVQNGGKATLWGKEIGGPFESNIMAGYTNNQWHTLKLVVDGVDFKMYIDNATSPALTKKFNKSFFRSGYISLISVNNDCSFKNLTIKELEVLPLAKAYEQETTLNTTASNSLVKLAGDSLDSIDELAYVTKTNVEVKKEKTPFEFGGIGLTIAMAVLSLGIIVAILLLLKSKKGVHVE